MKWLSIVILILYSLIYVIVNLVLKNQLILNYINFILGIGVVFLINLFMIKKFKYLDEILEDSKKIKDGNLNHKIFIKGTGSFSNLASNINSVVDLANECVVDNIKSDIVISNFLKEVSLNNNIEKKDLDSILYKVTSSANPILEPIDLNVFINDILAYYKTDFEVNNLDLKYSSSENNLVINSDKNLLYQVLTILVSNILKHSLDNTKVYIQLQSIENNIYLSLKNISKDEINLITIRDLNNSNIRLCENILALQNIIFNVEIEASLFKSTLIFQT